MKNLKMENKVKMLVAGLFLTLSTGAMAQKVELGFRIMPTFTAMEFNTSDGGTVKAEGTIGWGIGGFLGVNFTNHVGAQVEVIYTTLSQQYKEADITHDITLKYVNIPLLLSLNTGKDKPVNFNVVAGPQIGLNVGSDINSQSSDGTTSAQAKLQVKKSDIGFAFGAGIDFGLTSTVRLGLGYRGVRGLIDISDSSNALTTDDYYVLDRTKTITNAGYVGISLLF
ncbi:MAG: PorT family protein [Bacteroidetes bacterium]|nr:PorT family protein [Bacteroidota bacterium]MBP9790851.1 PorT family protein [Bacteroidia bacterium]